MLEHESRGADLISSKPDMTGWMNACERNVCRRRQMPAHFSSGHMVNNPMTVIDLMECYS